MNDFPSTLGALLAWIASGTGIGVILVWLAGLPIWLVLPTDGDFVKWLKSTKSVDLALVGLALGIGAMKATSYLPAGVPADWDQYYKLLLTVVNIVIAIGAANVVKFRYLAWQQRVNLDLDAKRATLHARAAAG